ncbi:type IV pilin-like G/H family protein [Coleofasciculus sp. E2-BRE-01]|uniref:type IV pilin-like G/H family protein n=1 Tax=Coleofasciculus sp. E2-BRE-01 TaxID=3069524 RepID=UPI0032FA16AB
MKTELKAKFLQHLNQKKQNQGFTLIELLVVIIIIGILSAIALPSFLNQANKAKQSEAKQYVGSMNRSQQAFYLERGYFADETKFGNLGLGIKTETTNYSYTIAGGADAPPADPQTPGPASFATNQAQPRIGTLKAYLGGVSTGEIQDTNEATTLAVLCEALKASQLDGGAAGTEEATPTDDQSGPVCPAGTYENIGDPQGN